MKMMDKSNRSRELAEAAEWYLKINDPDFSPDDYKLWLNWIGSDSRHAKAFDEIVGLSDRLDHAAADLEDIAIPDERSVADDEYFPDRPVGEWLDSMARRPESGSNQWRWWPAAAVVAGIVALSVVYFAVDANLSVDGNSLRTYVTPESQHRNVELADGSTIEIGAGTTVSISYSGTQRTAILENGEAYFVVARDERRPFRVLAGRGTITALGTEFNVRRSSDHVLITVTAGRVNVTPHRTDAAGPPASGENEALVGTGQLLSATLGVGQQVAYDAGGLQEVIAADIAIATSWKEHRLQYLREPLRHVIAGVNRYSSIDIILADSELGALTFTGTVYDGQTEEWLEGLSNVLPVDVEYVGNNSILLKQRN